MAKIFKFPSTTDRKIQAFKLKYRQPVCDQCKTTDPKNIIKSKLCFGFKQFIFFGKNICSSDIAHFHLTCQRCGLDRIQE